MLNGQDLFSGIGGLTLALREWVRPIAYCENDRYAQSVLLSRMRDGALPVAPIWGDVRTLSDYVLPRASHLPIDIIYGGFPCQDISSAGRGVGLGGERSGLFFEVVRLARDIRPRFVFLENVPAITTRGLERVCLEFTSLGYDSRWTTLSAASVGAPHLRERWWFMAHAPDDRIRWRKSLKKGSKGARNVANTKGIGLKPMRDASDASLQRTDWSQDANNGSGENHLANSESKRSKKRRQSQRETQKDSELVITSEMENAKCVRLQKSWREKRWSTDSAADASWWSIEPNVGRVANGVPHRVDRIRGLGNAVVPLQAREAFKRLCGLA